MVGKNKNNMSVKDVIEALRVYNEWRRYDGPLNEGPQMPEPTTIGKTIEAACEMLGKLNDKKALLTWQDVRDIVNIADEAISTDDGKCAFAAKGEENYYKYVLDTFLEQQESKITVEYIKRIGWDEAGLINGRQIFSIGRRAIFWHTSGVGILDDQTFIYCELSRSELNKFTDLVLEEERCEEDANSVTYAYVMSVKTDIENFIASQKDKHSTVKHY